jgi:hypothetical protein
MVNEPHWLLQEMAGEAVWTALLFGGAWVYKNRERIRDRLGSSSRKPVLLSGTIASEATFEGTPTVGSERQILYNVEAATPSLARRLEDLVAWYLHVS